jgi:threonyl-tRNA synthetase
LPLWLAPDQIVVASIGEAQKDYADAVSSRFDNAGFRVVADTRSERLSRKIVDARDAGIPVLMAVGAIEEREKSVSIRQRSGAQLTCSIDDALERLRPDAFRP